MQFARPMADCIYLPPHDGTGQFNVGGPATCSQIMFKNSPASTKYSFPDRSQILHLVSTCHPTLAACDTRSAKCGECECVHRDYVKKRPNRRLCWNQYYDRSCYFSAMWEVLPREAVPRDRTFLIIVFSVVLCPRTETHLRDEIQYFFKLISGLKCYHYLL